MARLDVTAIPVKPEEAIAFFRAKGFKLEQSFDWRDVSARQHAESFTVAKSTGFDILKDIHAALDQAIAEGRTLAWFEEQLTPILQEKGWWGKQEMVDPATGKTKLVQLGSPRRLRVIFNTNLRMAYMASKWQRFMRLAERRPWLRYVAVLDERVRRTHRSWHGTILKWDHPWWEKHFPPNDFGCRCDVQQLSDRDMQRFGFEPSRSVPTMLERSYVNPRTGEQSRVPDGIKPGFDHNVGQLAREAHAGKRLMDRLAGMPPAMAAEAFQSSLGIVLSGVTYEFRGWLREIIGLGLATGSSRIIASLPPAAVAALGAPAPAVLRVESTVASLMPDVVAQRLPQLAARPMALVRDDTGQLLLVVEPLSSGTGGRDDMQCLVLLADGTITGSAIVPRAKLILQSLLWGSL